MLYDHSLNWRLGDDVWQSVVCIFKVISVFSSLPSLTHSVFCFAGCAVINSNTPEVAWPNPQLTNKYLTYSASICDWPLDDHRRRHRGCLKGNFIYSLWTYKLSLLCASSSQPQPEPQSTNAQIEGRGLFRIHNTWHTPGCLIHPLSFFPWFALSTRYYFHRRVRSKCHSDYEIKNSAGDHHRIEWNVISPLSKIFVDARL